MTSVYNAIASDRIVYAVPRRVIPADRIPILAQEKAHVKFYSENVISNKRVEMESSKSTIENSGLSADVLANSKIKQRVSFVQSMESQLGLSFQQSPPTEQKKTSDDTIQNRQSKAETRHLNLRKEFESALLEQHDIDPCLNAKESKVEDFAATTASYSLTSVRPKIERCPNPFAKFIASLPASKQLLVEDISDQLFFEDDDYEDSL